MGKHVRILALGLSIALLAFLLPACGQSTTPTSAPTQGTTPDATPTPKEVQGVTDVNDPYGLPNDMGNYPLAEKVTLTYWVPIEGWAAPAISSYDDNDIFKEIEAITNVHIEWIHPAVGQVNEQFSLLVASDELPDIIQPAGLYKGGVTAGIKDGVYLRLNDYALDYAPNYMAFRESDDDRRKTTLDDEGNLGAFYCLSPYGEWAWWGPMVKKAWLDDLQLQVPETMSDWYTMLKAFKEQKGADFPLVFSPTGDVAAIDWCGIFLSAYDAYEWVFYRDGKVRFGPTQPGMKEALTELRKWYAEGLIDSDFATRDWNSFTATILSEECGAFTQSPDTAYGMLAPQNIEFVAAPYPVLEKGDVIHYRWKHFKNGGQEAAITTSCVQIEAAVKFLDFGYTRKGWQLYNYGMPDITHKLDENKVPYLWEGSIIYNDPDQVPAVNALWKYKMHWGPFIRDEHNANPIIVQSVVSGEMRQFWTDSIDGAYFVPPVTFSAEESSRVSALDTQIRTLRNEVFAKIIRGTEPVDAWDTFVTQANDVGLEEFLELYNTALERYNQR